MSDDINYKECEKCEQIKLEDEFLQGWSICEHCMKLQQLAYMKEQRRRRAVLEQQKRNKQ